MLLLKRLVHFQTRRVTRLRFFGRNPRSIITFHDPPSGRCRHNKLFQDGCLNLWPWWLLLPAVLSLKWIHTDACFGVILSLNKRQRKLSAVRVARPHKEARGHSFSCARISDPQGRRITAACLPPGVPFQQCGPSRGASFAKRHMCLGCTFFSLRVLFHCAPGGD